MGAAVVQGDSEHLGLNTIGYCAIGINTKTWSHMAQCGLLPFLLRNCSATAGDLDCYFLQIETHADTQLHAPSTFLRRLSESQVLVCNKPRHSDTMYDFCFGPIYAALLGLGEFCVLRHQVCCGYGPASRNLFWLRLAWAWVW
jgi:hypothetical protein